MSGMVHDVGTVKDFDGHKIHVGVDHNLTVVRSVGARLTPEQLGEFAHLLSVAGRIAYANGEQMAGEELAGEDTEVEGVRVVTDGGTL